jgi:chromosome partitioning protein
LILLIGGEKGGTGKSTIATNLAIALSCEKQDVIIIDADPQGTASKWVSRRNRNHPSFSKVHCVQKTGDIFDTIKDLSSRYQHIIIDAGGRDSEELRSAMVASKKIYIPIKASQPDLETIEHMAKIVRLAQSMNKNLEPYIIAEAEDAQKILSKIKSLNISEIIIKERKVYRDAMIDGKGVIELDNHKATEEILLLKKEIYQ